MATAYNRSEAGIAYWATYYQSEAYALSDRRSKLAARYRITLEEYERLLTAQGGRCANPGCRTDRPGSKRSRWFHVDHDHATGRIRGLLCSGCNTAAGQMKDAPVRIRGLAEYLTR